MTEGPYKLPEGWRWVRLGKVCDIISGFAFKASDFNTCGLGMPVIKIGDIDKQTTEAYYSGSCERLPVVEPGDLLVGLTGSFKVATWQGPRALLNQRVAKIGVKNKSCYAKWLELAISFSIQGLVREIPEATVKNVLVRHLKAHPIPLPPLSEQRRIVARIEELMARVREARRLHQEALEDAERLWQSVLADTFPRPGQDLPKGWRWVRLGEVCRHKTGIWGPEAPDSSKGFPVVRSTEIHGMVLMPQKASVRAIRSKQIWAYKLEAGDILINKSSGSPHLVGWPAIFEDPHDGRTYLFSNFMLRLRPEKELLEPWFLLFYLHSPIARSLYLGAQDTTSGLRNLRIRDFMEQSVPLPPLSEQRRIVTYLEAVQERIRALKTGQSATEAELTRLEQSILDKAFRGEL
ncbi:restriction endonuclease subunit S [Thermosynechococcus sp. PKX82]|uniref:restriction endonuclease subunit S n=1 Tax=Thermosynechococcus sp. PKX82 TaxID=3074086 RepID=UPI0028736471|nr:restriction endonuclease subunit S [Thermosynechococcus sp. PKX82]WNC30171.1 restriction endonuclease subunit S [Thermosynechococcus sp. PKX82]